MKQRLLRLISALFILLLASSCAGIKPLFHAGNVSALIPPDRSNMTEINRHMDSFSYVPSSAEESGILDMNKRQYRLSTSLPASVKFEF